MSSIPPTRINKFICESGICSRKAADIDVKRGLVFINGSQAALGDKVLPGDEVTVNGLVIEPLAPDKVIFILLNKPAGIVCTAARSDPRNVVDFIAHTTRVYPVGRLDKDSQGLLFLTNRCDLVDKILHSDNHHEKEYMVTVDREITDDFLTGISCGVPVLGVVTKRCQAARVSACVLKITLTQGLNRQIRRMCKHYGYRVVKLERVRIMHLSTTGFATGEWRTLVNDELLYLYRVLHVPLPDNVQAQVVQ